MSDQIENRIEETEKYIDELEYLLCDYDNVVAEREYIKSELTKGQSKLDSIKIEKTNVLNELKRETKELCCKYNTQEGHLIDIQEENKSLKCQNDQILNKLDDLQVSIDKLNDISSTLLENKKVLERKLSEVMEITNQLQHKHQLAKSEAQDREQDIICIEKDLADKITQIAELEKNINIEEDRNECLQCTICELQMKCENICKTLQAEMAEIRCKFNEKSDELCMLKLNLKDKHAEVLEQKDRTMQLEEEIDCVQKGHCKEKCKIDKEIGELRCEIKSLASNLKLINSKLCKAQMECTKTKCQIREQSESIKQLEPMKEMLQQEAKRIKETLECTTEMITTQRKKHDNDKQMFDKKLISKYQEQCKLKELSKNQTEQLTKLKKKMADVKCDLAHISQPSC